MLGAHNRVAMKPRIPIGSMLALSASQSAALKPSTSITPKSHVVVQTCVGSTDTRFPILIAGIGEFADLDVSMRAKAISGKGRLAYGAS
jgi:hypothetical protein